MFMHINVETTINRLGGRHYHPDESMPHAVPIPRKYGPRIYNMPVSDEGAYQQHGIYAQEVPWWEMRLRIDKFAPVARDWIGGVMSLQDVTGCPVAGPRPFILYAPTKTPATLPIYTTFEPTTFYGGWSVGMRVTHPVDPEVYAGAEPPLKRQPVDDCQGPHVCDGSEVSWCRDSCTRCTGGTPQPCPDPRDGAGVRLIPSHWDQT